MLENIIGEGGDLIENALSKRECSCFITSVRPKGKASMITTRRCAMAEFVRVARAGEIAPGEGMLVEADGKKIALFNVDGKFHAIDDTCTHRGGPLSEGMVVGTEVTCPWHGAVFRVTNGSVLGPPAPLDRAHYAGRLKADAAQMEIQHLHPTFR